MMMLLVLAKVAELLQREVADLQREPVVVVDVEVVPDHGHIVRGQLHVKLDERQLVARSVVERQNRVFGLQVRIGERK